METHNHPTPPSAACNPEKRQVNDKTAKRARVRSGQGTVAYWKAKLFRNTYRDRDGNTVEIPEFYARMRHEGKTKRVRLHTSDKDKAAEEAMRLSERLSVEGWGVVTAGQARLPVSPSIEEFCDAYTKAAQSMESPPRPISAALSLRHLRQICSIAGVTRLRELTPEAIERGRDKYRAMGRAAKREDTAIQNSVGIILRNAAACFSAEARAILARQGLDVENPFAGIKRSQKIEPVAALDRKIVDQIWKDLPLLRDGDPDAEAPNLKRFARSYQKKHEGNKPRWQPIDYRQPHPEAYCAILLGLGLGLRANEIDKSRWSWVKFDAKGDAFFEIGEEADFKPKGGSLRIIRIPTELHEELAKSRQDLNSPYILGGQPSGSVEKNGWGYRCRETLRIANDWLRARGVESGVVRGNPLHRLRKQFGSEVATAFGLFAAQKLLGHSSPMVTAKYYAAQTELPVLMHVHLVK
jgi:integrase